VANSATNFSAGRQISLIRTLDKPIWKNLMSFQDSGNICVSRWVRLAGTIFPRIIERFAKMFLLSHRSLRGIILGLMFFLAGTSCCWSDSYDPDPYDNIPPVITVDFNYVVPSLVTVRAPRPQVNAPQRMAVRISRLQTFATPELFFNIRTGSPLGQSPSNLVIPLRR